MMVLISKNFSKQYQKLNKNQRDKVDQRIRLFRTSPFDPILRNHALKGKYENYRSIDIAGDLRAIYEPVDEKTAHFIYLGTHSNLYG